jgi:hypothetical protein
VGATWEPVEDVLHRNKGLVLTHGRAAPVELGSMCAALRPCTRSAGGSRRRRRPT